MNDRANKTGSGKHHQILLSPELTALIIVDHQVVFESCFNRKAAKAAENGAANLLGTAEKVNVPVISSLVKTNLIGSKLNAKLENLAAINAVQPNRSQPLGRSRICGSH